MSQPIPDRLIRDLGRVPTLEPYEIRKYVWRESVLTPTLRATLELICKGYSTREIAEMRHYSEAAIQDHSKRLLAIFRARRRPHLAALAVAQGYVDVRSSEPLPRE